MDKTSYWNTIKTGLVASPVFFLWLCAPALAFNAPKSTDLPDSITVGGKEFSLKSLSNPLRNDSGNLEKHIKDGGVIYFKQCFLCHGDLMDGGGLFGNRLNPRPANFKEAARQGKKDNYFFWRIMKGGPGLSQQFKPWESAMPAWEETLSEEEVWKVILFIFDAVEHPTVPNPPAEPSVERGKEVYLKKCTFCHGEDGGGKGVSAPLSSPRPRNFIKGHYKFRSTPFGKIPTDDDLYQMLIRGMPGTTMPSWKHFPEVDLKSLVLYLKSLSKKFAKFVKRGKTHKIIPIPPTPEFSQERAKRGKELFNKTCSGCHGLKGRSDGESTKKNVNIETDAIRPRNLSKPWTFRRGNSPEQLFQTIRTGLSTTAMPRHSKRIYDDEAIWDIVFYISQLSVSLKPSKENAVKVTKIADDKVFADSNMNYDWSPAKTYLVPVAGQILQSEKLYYPTVDGVMIQALHNGNEIAIRMRWDDPTFDPILKKTAEVTESPAPPLPPELQVAPEEINQPAEEPEPQKFPDALALQFPSALPEDGTLPYFLNGDPDHPVNLWQWNSHPNKVVELTARGMKQVTPHPESSQKVQSKLTYQYGQYQLVLKRSLTTEDTQNDTQFEAGKSLPMAINVWDGNRHETGTQRAVSSWVQLVLE